MPPVIRVCMPNWKAAEPASLRAELLKIDHPEFIRYFHDLLINVWRTGDALQQWKDTTIKVLHKKKGRSNCNNYRGFSLVAHSGKVLLKMVASLLTTARPKGYSPRNSAAFAQHDQWSTCCSCADCKNSDELEKSPRTCASSTFRKHMTPSTVYARFGVPEKMLTVIRQFHEGMRARVRMDDGEHGEWFDVTLGLRQGWCLVTASVQCLLRCYDTRRAGTLQ